MEKVHSPISAPTPSPKWYNPTVPTSAITYTPSTPIPLPHSATNSDSDSDIALPTSSAATIIPLTQSTIIPVTHIQNPLHSQGAVSSLLDGMPALQISCQFVVTWFQEVPQGTLLTT
jgi:hypothetical protein